MVTPVRMKPPASCRDSAEPAVPGGASSETAAENWAESATTVRPQPRDTSVTTMGSAPNRSPTATADRPLPAIAAIVSVVRPSLSARAPATAQPIPPTATTAKAVRLALAGSSEPAAANEAAMNSGSHVHIA